MTKEIWIQRYETEIENLAEEHDIECEEAEIMLEKILDKDPRYLS